MAKPQTYRNFSDPTEETPFNPFLGGDAHIMTNSKTGVKSTEILLLFGSVSENTTETWSRIDASNLCRSKLAPDPGLSGPIEDPSRPAASEVSFQ
jgi:hypothetical protein